MLGRLRKGACLPTLFRRRSHYLRAWGVKDRTDWAFVAASTTLIATTATSLVATTLIAAALVATTLITLVLLALITLVLLALITLVLLLVALVLIALMVRLEGTGLLVCNLGLQKVHRLLHLLDLVVQFLLGFRSLSCGGRHLVRSW